MSSLHTAFSLLTRFPLPTGQKPEHPENAVWVYPIVGLVLGGVVYVLGWSAHYLGLYPSVVSVLMLGCLTILTGAKHEDGLADCADGFWGGWTRERRLDIMSNSHIGTYGICALILIFLLRWQTMTQLFDVHLLAIFGVLAFSRSILPVVMLSMTYARRDGLVATQNKPPAIQTMISLVIGVSSLILFAPTLGLGLLALIACCVVTLGLMLLAKAKINGITGDVLGAILLINESVCLLCFSQANLLAFL